MGRVRLHKDSSFDVKVVYQRVINRIKLYAKQCRLILMGD